MPRLPRVAPHDSCIACSKGDTTTGLVLVGCSEFQAAGLAAMGVPMAEAIATIQEWSDSPEFPVRVCAECAARAHMVVGLAKSGTLPGYHEPEA
jgi:hypothetical protein